MVSLIYSIYTGTCINNTLARYMADRYLIHLLGAIINNYCIQHFHAVSYVTGRASSL